MNNEAFDDIAIEQACKDQFGVSFDIGEILVRGLSTGQSSFATVF